jgi:DNA-binding transcriptional ArsR family regulator
MTGSAPPLPAVLADLAAGRLRVLGQATRIRLIGELEHGERTIQEIADALGTTQQNISQHLGILHQAGVLAREKRGTRVVYRLVDPYFGEIIDCVLASLAHQSEELARATGKRSD